MSAFDLNFYFFLAATGIFGVAAVVAVPKIDSPYSFFHHSSTKQNILSFTAANVPLGTGLAYALSGSQQNGVLMLLAPLMVFFGYYLLSRFLRDQVNPKLFEAKNILSGFEKQISQQRGVSVAFVKPVTVCLILTFTLLLAFELFASSKILSFILLPRYSVSGQAFISLMVALIALTYTIFGGIIAVFRTDKIQLTGILIFIPMLFYTAVYIPSSVSSIKFDFGAVFKINGDILLGMTAATIAAITTQFYSILNWSGIYNVKNTDKPKFALRVGLFSSLILMMIVIVGVLGAAASDQPVLAGILSTYSSLGERNDVISLIVSAISVFGLTCMVFSTVDSLAIAILMFYYDNVSERDSFNRETAPNEIRRIRGTAIAFFSVSLIILGGLNYLQANIFYLLIAITAGVVVIAPMFIVMGFLSSRSNALAYISRTIIYNYVGLFFFSSFAAGIVFTKFPGQISLVTIGAFLASGSYSLIVYYRAMRA